MSLTLLVGSLIASTKLFGLSFGVLRIETIALRSLVCSVADGGLGLRDFRTHSQAMCLAR